MQPEGRCCGQAAGRPGSMSPALPGWDARLTHEGALLRGVDTLEFFGLLQVALSDPLGDSSKAVVLGLHGEEPQAVEGVRQVPDHLAGQFFQVSSLAHGAIHGDAADPAVLAVSGKARLLHNGDGELGGIVFQCLGHEPLLDGVTQFVRCAVAPLARWVSSSHWAITPYVGWQMPGGMNLWTTAGYGFGKVKIEDKGSDGQRRPAIMGVWHRCRDPRGQPGAAERGSGLRVRCPPRAGGGDALWGAGTGWQRFPVMADGGAVAGGW